jgi:hypothetical protein
MVLFLGILNLPAVGGRQVLQIHRVCPWGLPTVISAVFWTGLIAICDGRP